VVEWFFCSGYLRKTLETCGVFVVSCGGMRGNAGGLAAVFPAQKMGQGVSIFLYKKKTTCFLTFVSVKRNIHPPSGPFIFSFPNSLQ
jgi:hypothetical protein